MANNCDKDPFGQYFPQAIFDRLLDDEAATTTTCAFNRRANLVAAGTRDGRCLVWDLDTRSIALRLKGHAQPITSVCWTRCGRFILTSSRDWNCVLWDLALAARRHTVKFASPVLEARMHPRSRRVFVALLQGQGPCLVRLSDKPGAQPIRIQLDVDEAIAMPITSTNDVACSSAAQPGADSSNTAAAPATATASEILVTAIAFSHNGKRIFAGTTKGHIAVFDSETGQLISTLRVSTSLIKNICCGKNKKDLLVNAHDRTIRWFILSQDPDGTLTAELQNKYQDSVDRNQWTQCCFSADGEMVIGALASNQKHNIYIWDKVMGNLVKMLEGPREGLSDMVWHPYRPIIATVSLFGTIYFWGVIYTQNFSAFAPSFTELEDNVEYKEREDEFDLDIEEENKGFRSPQNEDAEVEVVNYQAGTIVSDTDDDGQYSFASSISQSDTVTDANLGLSDDDQMGHKRGDGPDFGYGDNDMETDDKLVIKSDDKRQGRHKRVPFRVPIELQAL